MDSAGATPQPATPLERTSLPPSKGRLHPPSLDVRSRDSTSSIRSTAQDLTPEMSSSCNPDGALCFEYWPDEAQPHPSFVYIKGGLKPTKC